MTYTATRRLEWDSAHRVMRHESKCSHLHGHRYAAEVTCKGALDSVGRVIDFGAIKEVVGAFIDLHWDHGTLVNPEDAQLLAWLKGNEQKHWQMMNGEPTAENIASELYFTADGLLKEQSPNLSLVRVRVYETPNCWADFG